MYCLAVLKAVPEGNRFSLICFPTSSPSRQSLGAPLVGPRSPWLTKLSHPLIQILHHDHFVVRFVVHQFIHHSLG